MLRMTEVVKNLLIINVIVFFAVWFLIPIPGNERYFILSRPDHAGFEPVQLITHMFMHANFEHLFFNLVCFWAFGCVVEMLVGCRWMMALIVSSAIFESIVFNFGIQFGSQKISYFISCGWICCFFFTTSYCSQSNFRSFGGNIRCDYCICYYVS